MAANSEIHRNMKVLALDFDGVISDSALESFIVALRTFRVLEPESAWAERAEGLASCNSDVIRQHDLFRDFLDLMPLGNRAEDFGVALRCLSTEASVPDQHAWDALRDSEDPEFLATFHRAFYREREALWGRDPAGWLALLAPFSSFVDVIRRHRHDCVLALATAKDRASVERLLDAYAISDLFTPERILDKEDGVSKRAHLSALRERTGVPFADITFVDDKLKHLESVAALGVRGVLAGWGYNGEREWRLAEQKGFLVCNLDEVEAQLF